MKSFKPSRLRFVTLTAGVLIIIGATIASKGLGTYCNLCPLGFLQITAASRSIPWQMIPGVLLGLVLIYVLGSFFCTWLCTTALLRKLFPRNPAKTRQKTESPFLTQLPYLILATSVAVSFVVQFPVFCLVCPIGLFWGFVYAVFKLFVTFDPGWNLVIFPAIIAAEVLVFRKWCSFVCPVGAVFRLLAKIPGPKLRPKINTETCLHAQGKNCHVCSRVCPEDVEIVKNDRKFHEKCSNCLECLDHCPTHSIFYFRKADVKANTNAMKN